MHKKRYSKVNLHKHLMKEVHPDEVLHTHAYRKVEKKDGPSLRRPNENTENETIAEYKNSMVGSIAQYRDKMPIKPLEKSAINPSAHADDGMIGNRPKHGAEKEAKKDSSLDRRHHFIEPPKRGYNRFG